MHHPLTLGATLLLSSTLLAPAALAQTPPSPATTTSPPQPQADTSSQAEDVEISTPGPDGTADETVTTTVDVSAPGASGSDEVIVIQGRFIPEPIRATSEVISVLSSEEIARTGEGDIAGALQRVTGLSLVGGRFVFVRGLGERYSLALLNGLPLPSPEPLRRVVPLDLFPTSVIASSVVQKSFSANYPGEFGGGVINLTTIAIPDETFLSIGGSIGVNSETNLGLGYTYYGSQTDWTGFDDGTRDIPAPLQAALDSNNLIVAGTDFSETDILNIVTSLQNANTTLVQRNDEIPPNGSVEVTAGSAFDIGSDRLGVIFTAGWDNGWQTRSGLQQVATGPTVADDGTLELVPVSDFDFVSTENRIVVNGLLGLGYEFDESRIRFTNLFIRDTSKEARIQVGTNEATTSALLNRTFTSWFERQLFTSQLVAEFEFDRISVDVRGTYANSQREAPYERSFSYALSAFSDSGDFENDLNTPGQDAGIAFSDLSEDVWAGGVDLSYDFDSLPRDLTITAGYAYSDTTRTSVRRAFRFIPLDGVLPQPIPQLRPDFLFSDVTVANFRIGLTDLSSVGGVAEYDAGLEIHAGYVRAEAELADFVRATVGVRYEDATEFVAPLDLFADGGPVVIGRTEVNEDYWLPAGTITWNFADDMQLRLAASKTIARPQFRELSPQLYFDTESDRQFNGNPFLTDSELLNFEARYEWYLGRNERISLAGFYKDIDNPIEAIARAQGSEAFQTFANAPSAQLYGGEIEVQKYFPLLNLGLEGGLFETRDLVVAANYTYTNSELSVGEGDETINFVGQIVPAANFFDDGDPLTGQSDHIANLQIGIEDSEGLSQQTLLFSYASKRVTGRGTNGLPDVFEEPGFTIDFVARQGFELAGLAFEAKFEARNLTDENYEEFQTLNGTRLDRFTYDRGTSVSLGIGVTF